MLQYICVSSLVLIEARMKETGVAFPLLSLTIKETLLQGISKTIRYLENQITKKIPTGILE